MILHMLIEIKTLRSFIIYLESFYKQVLVLSIAAGKTCVPKSKARGRYNGACRPTPIHWYYLTEGY